MPLFKVAIFVALFWWLAWSGSIIAGIAYIAWGGFLHITFFNRKTHSQFFFSFLSLYVLGLALALTVSPSTPIEVVGLALGALLFIVWGVYAPIFSQYRLYASIFYYVFFFVASAWASSEVFAGGWWLVPLVWAGLYAVTREYMSLFLDAWDRRTHMFALVLSLFAVEGILLASLLSIGALNVASLAMIFVLVALDLYVQAMRGVLTGEAVYKDAAIFAGLSGLVLAIPLFFG
ncbi:MAG: hypothetical protein WC246_03695 [Candidatus Paceibacterota bacterium]